MVVQQFINRIRNCPLARDIIKKFFIPVIKERKNIEKEVEDILKVLRKNYCSGEYANKDCICAWFKFFEDVGRLHEALELKAFWEIIFPNHLNDLSESLQLFISNYAYMRPFGSSYSSIRVRIHGFIGAVCIDRNFNLHNNTWISNICNCYENNLRMLGLGFYTSDTLDPRYNINPSCNINSTTTNKCGLLYIISNTQITASLVSYLLNLLRNGNIYDAYNFLIRIRGVGDKIACLFLRDISIIHNLMLYGDCRDLLYKPIDRVVKKVIEELVKCKCKLNYNFDINEVLEKFDYTECRCIQKLRKNAKIDSNDFKTLYPYKIFLYEYSKKCKLDQRYVEMGMWFFNSKVAKYYNRRLCKYTIQEACKDLIKRLRKAINNTNIRYIGNNQFEININGKIIIVSEDELIDLILKGEIEIYDELLDIIFF
ncbi:hypothetical protein [Methanocaldococcus jannaschii]|nr:hypothetical protein [Methanocaldococcus jannaschii]